MKNIFCKLRSRGVALQVAILGLSVAASSAHAVLPTWATTMVTDAGTAGSDSASAVGPVIGAVMVAGIIIKLVKRFGNKI